MVQKTAAIRAAPADYLPTACSSIDQLDVAAWNQVCNTGQPDVSMDIGYLLCIQQSMANQMKFWYVIVRDACARPIACACLTELTLDPLVLAAGLFKKLGSHFRRVFPQLLSFKILMCGLPVSTGDSALRFAPGAEPWLALRTLDGVLQTLARRSGASFLLFKEFEDSDRNRMAGLVDLGYTRAESLPMNSFDFNFTDFEHYLSSLKAHYRQDIRRSQAKLERAGCAIHRLRGGAFLEQFYTADLHRLYLAVLDRAANKLEVLPREFFLALTRQFRESISFTYISRGSEVVAFNWAFQNEHSYRLLFCGLDYELNAEAELYFNLMYAELDNALKAHVTHIHIGQTADAFKSRLGCSQTPLWLYVKATRVPKVGRMCFTLFFPHRERTMPHNIYKSTLSAPCSSPAMTFCSLHSANMQGPHS